jgi:hypothetical protein
MKDWGKFKINQCEWCVLPGARTGTYLINRGCIVNVASVSGLSGG